MASEKNTVLVTGASGFIAKHIVLKLLQEGYSVRGSVRTATRAEEVRNAVSSGLPEGFDLDGRLEFVELDLTRDAGWSDALAGVDVLMHTASPFPLAEPQKEDDLIRPAVDGTLRALGAAKEAGVRRVILTSSVAAVAYGKPGPDNGERYTDSDWSDTDSPIGAYSKSKTLAERAAWDFVRGAPEIALTVINPAMVIGPALDRRIGSSLEVMQRIMNRDDPMAAPLQLGVVDVRDLAAMHVAAIDKPESAGRRFIGATGSYWMLDLARSFARAFPERRFAKRNAPYPLLRLLALFDKTLRSVMPMLYKEIPLDATPATNILGIEFRKLDESIRDTGQFLIDNGLLKKP